MMEKTRSWKAQPWSSATSYEIARPWINIVHRREQVVTAAYVNRRVPRARTTGYRPPSPRPINEHWPRPRSRSPVASQEQIAISPELERELDVLVGKFRVRKTQKRQMRLFLELGLSVDELSKLLRRRTEVLSHKPSTIRKKFEFLVEHTRMTQSQFKKFFLKFPRILEYSMKRTVKPRLDFLLSIGCEREDLAKILIQAPAVTELSVENTLAPRVEFLRETIGIRAEQLRKTLVKKPQLLTFSQESMASRVAFLQEWNMGPLDIARVVTIHPQILHYSVQSMSEHIRFLLHLGILKSNIHRVITRFPQILSLDLKVNVIPKVRYLCSELGGNTEMLENNPVFVGLSLKKRIIPRHRFLSSLHSVDIPSPVPMNWFKCSDKVFASNIAKVPLEDFVAFKERCLQEH